MRKGITTDTEKQKLQQAVTVREDAVQSSGWRQERSRPVRDRAACRYGARMPVFSDGHRSLRNEVYL